MIALCVWWVGVSFSRVGSPPLWYALFPSNLEQEPENEPASVPADGAEIRKVSTVRGAIGVTLKGKIISDFDFHNLTHRVYAGCYRSSNYSCSCPVVVMCLHTRRGMPVVHLSNQV